MSNDEPETYGNLLMGTQTGEEDFGAQPPKVKEYDSFSDWKQREEEDTMETPDFSEIFDHLKRGAETSAVDEASELVLDLFRDFIGDEETANRILDNTFGREGAKGVTALAFHYLADVNPSWMPKPKGIKRVCGIVIENSSRNVLKQVASMTDLRSKLVNLAKLGENLDDLEEVDEPLGELTDEQAQEAEFEGVDSTTSQREAVEEHGETQRR